jgi:DNA-binding NtrC family response regulator
LQEGNKSPAGGGDTLLVVEDQPALRRTLKLVLERAGFRVILAEDGREGLELARAHATEIDLVLSDLVMPNMGGVELFQGLKEEGLELPFIMTSGYAGFTASGLTELDASVPVVKKPWKPSDLVRLIREKLDRR